MVVVGRDGYKLMDLRRHADRARRRCRSRGTRRRPRRAASSISCSKRSSSSPASSKRRWPDGSTRAATCTSRVEIGEITTSACAAMTKIAITGCGTAYHAGMVGMYLLRSLWQAAGRDGACKRVSLRRSGYRPADARDRDVAVRRDRRHDRSRAGSRRLPAPPILGICNVARLASDARRRRHALHARRPGDRRRGDQDLRLADHGDDAALRSISRELRGTVEPSTRLRAIAENTKLLPAAVDVVLEHVRPDSQGGAQDSQGCVRCSSSDVTSTSRPRSRARSS